jgi:predicted membrane protein
MRAKSACETTLAARPRRYAAFMTAPVPATAARPPAPRSSVNTRVLGGLLLVFGSGWMLKAAGILDIPWSAIVSLVLIALGLALIVTFRSRARTVPLLALGAALTVGLTIGTSNIGLRGGFGQRTLTGQAVLAAPVQTLGFGELLLDLRNVDLPEGQTTTIRAHVGFGQLQVRVPNGVELRVDAQAKFGAANVFGSSLDVHGQGKDSRSTAGYDKATTRLRLILSVGGGEIDVSH